MIPLPEMVEMELLHHGVPVLGIKGYTADQMRAYGDARAVEALERAAALVESRAGPLRTGAYDVLLAAAAAIRDL